MLGGISIWAIINCFSHFNTHLWVLKKLKNLGFRFRRCFKGFKKPVRTKKPEYLKKKKRPQHKVH